MKGYPEREPEADCFKWKSERLKYFTIHRKQKDFPDKMGIGLNSIYRSLGKDVVTHVGERENQTGSDNRGQNYK